MIVLFGGWGLGRYVLLFQFVVLVQHCYLYVFWCYNSSSRFVQASSLENIYTIFIFPVPRTSQPLSCCLSTGGIELTSQPAHHSTARFFVFQEKLKVFSDPLCRLVESLTQSTHWRAFRSFNVRSLDCTTGTCRVLSL